MANFGKCPKCGTQLAHARGIAVYCPKKGCPVGFDMGVDEAREKYRKKLNHEKKKK